MFFLFITSPCPVICFGPGPRRGPGNGPSPGSRPNLVPVLGLGPGAVIFLVPALVPVPSYFWSRPCFRSKFLVPSHSAHSTRYGWPYVYADIWEAAW